MLKGLDFTLPGDPEDSQWTSISNAVAAVATQETLLPRDGEGEEEAVLSRCFAQA